MMPSKQHLLPYYAYVMKSAFATIVRTPPAPLNVPIETISVPILRICREVRFRYYFATSLVPLNLPLKQYLFPYYAYVMKSAFETLLLEIVRYRVRSPLTASVVSLSKRLYPHCLVLVSIQEKRGPHGRLVLDY